MIAMVSVVKLPASPTLPLNNLYNRGGGAVVQRQLLVRPLAALPPSSSLFIDTAGDVSQASLVSSVGSPLSMSLQNSGFTQKHILMLNVMACASAISATWIFLSAIPRLLSLKQASESVEKLLDVTREELPETMAAVRLSGMEISDLTMELSDLGQEITQGVRSSTRAVRLAEDRLRRLTTMGPVALLQEETIQKTKTKEPVVARDARRLREGIVQGRMVLQVLFGVTRFSKWVILAARGQKK